MTLAANPTGSPQTLPRCPHFGVCGGCQYQDLAYSDQLALKRAHLDDLLRQASINTPPAIALHSAEPYGYRNRIRLRVQRVEGELRFGYNIRATTEFLPITTCPIAAPVLWSTAEMLLAAARADRDAAAWLSAATEVELFCDDSLTRLQLTFYCPPRTSLPRGSFARMMQAAQHAAPQIPGVAAIAGAAALAIAPRTGPTGCVFDTYGAPGLNYCVRIPNQPDETYWITRGGFFQVNRFLLPTLIELVCFDNGQPRRGNLAWDLYAGVGLFSRILSRKAERSFARITAVEANPTAAADLRRALPKTTSTSAAIESTTLDFLRSAVLQRDRPDLIVLDPPRAGAGLEACALLTRIAAPTLVYVSCDPSTLARDLAALQPSYHIAALHLVDLFPQTQHLETIAILEPK